MARYFFNVVAMQLSRAAGTRPALSMSRSENPTTRQQDGELKEETGVLASLTYLGKFAYHVPPENEIVAVFSCRSDDPIRIDPAESSEASFHTTDEVNAIAASERAATWLRRGWKILADVTISPE
jgi:isopentenyldiphosphate isomerase